jgi:hypothetical protein
VGEVAENDLDDISWKCRAGKPRNFIPAGKEMVHPFLYLKPSVICVVGIQPLLGAGRRVQGSILNCL